MNIFKANKGFTVVELLGVTAIIGIITAFVIVGRPKYESTILLSNAAYDVALNIRQAQVYGINVRGANQGAAYSFTAGYGVRLKTAPYSSATEGSEVTLVLFADINNNRRYDGGSEYVSTYQIKNGNKVSSLCVTTVGGGLPSGNSTGFGTVSTGSTGSGTCYPVGILDVTFRRPDPTACINVGLSLDDGSGTGVQNSSYCLSEFGTETSLITLVGKDGSTKKIKIYSSGQVTVI